MRAHHAPETQGFGFNMVGPAIIKYGTEAQKAHYLPKILTANISWCQGYSEPGAGSDLAGLQTRAESDGDAASGYDTAKLLREQPQRRKCTPLGLPEQVRAWAC